MPALQNRKFVAQGKRQLGAGHTRKFDFVRSLFAEQAYIYFTASVKSLRIGSGAISENPASRESPISGKNSRDYFRSSP
jgi:hypothetical protein